MAKESPSDQSIGRQIKRHRERAGLTIYALATAAGLSPSLLTRIECGEQSDPHWGTVSRLVVALGLSLGDFAAWSPQKESRKKLPNSAK